MSEQTQLSVTGAVALGLVLIAGGLFLVLFALGVVPGAGPSLEAPPWVAACAGLAFALCGGAVIIGFAVAGGAAPDGDLPAGTPTWIRLIQYLLGLGIVGSLAAIATWVAFGPGPRTFTMTGPFGRSESSETVGRAVFGTGAVLMYVFLVVFVVVSIRRLKRSR